MTGGQKLSSFKRTVREFYKKHGRHNLPWRKTTNPYRILVSEVMLQQTQVDRVIPYYRAFLKKFPTLTRLAEAPLSDVLLLWQGLGYNRRAKMLHETAKKIIKTHNRFPREYQNLIALPGVGEYTAKAIRVFAFNETEVMIETNIRTVFLHHFFPNKKNVTDNQLLPLIEKTLDRKNSREWYASLMDYGSHLKKLHPNPSRKSKHHQKQKPFKGSDREIRGAILRVHLSGGNSMELPFSKRRIQAQLKALREEGLI